MTNLRNLAIALVFRPAGLRALAARRSVVSSVLCLAAGFAAFVLIRNAVYAGLQDEALELTRIGWIGSFLRLNLLQIVLFLAMVYVPAIVCLSNAVAGDGLGLTLSREEYQTQLSALFPLWAALFLIAAPVQWLAPQFIVVGPFGISIGLLLVLLLLFAYTVWAIRELNHISLAAAAGVFVLSWFTLPVFYILTSFLFALPFFILIPLVFVAYQRFHTYFSGRAEERSFQQHLHGLTANPQDADAQYQLGLIHMRRHNLDAAQHYFEAAARVDASDADYSYYLGRVAEAKGDWGKALEHYEETYRLNSEYGQGDIFREVGKAYLQAGKTEKAVEFLEFFLGIRGSDPEGRYWLAVALGRLGKPEEMRVQLRTILEQARSQPRFFRKEKREWVFRSRVLLREQR